jgi:hypothetical protein
VGSNGYMSMVDPSAESGGSKSEQVRK